MTATVDTLLGITQSIALDFLHSVVLIDDRVYLPPLPTDEMPAPVPDEVRTPPRRGAVVEAEEPAITVPTEGIAVAVTEHPLNAKPLVDRFADQGLVCAALRLDQDEDARRTVKAAQRADIVVLDWKMNGNYGETTLQLMREIIGSGSDEARLRLFAIYTGENSLVEIVEQLRKELDALVGGKYEYSRNEPFAITRGPIRVAVYAKAGTQLPEEDPVLYGRIAAPEELPDRLLRDFAEMTSGLVSNVALDALARLRANMHRILRRLHPGLDAAYLAHRALVMPPEEAEEHLVSLVASEIAVILDENAVGRRANIDAIRTWLQDRIAAGADFKQAFNLGAEDPLTALCTLLSVGVGADDSILPAQFKQLRGMKNARGLTSRFCVPEQNAERRDGEFAMLLSLRDRHLTRPPDLTLGTVVARMKEGMTQYFVCMQASCDAVRLEQARAFPLLPLTSVTKEHPGFDVIVVEQGTVLRLKASRRPYEQKWVTFTPSKPSLTVKPRVKDETMIFTADDGDEYRWLGELKPEHAQRLLNELGSQQTRVGVTESEWMRRSRD